MVELLVVAFLGGLITGVSPCIVPVIPVVVAGGSSTTSHRRPFLIIAGLVVSFSLTVLFAQTVLSFLHLPLNFLFWFGIALLGAISLGLLIRPLGELLERPFARLGSTRYATEGGGFVLGLSLGPVFVPCAGPVLTAISVAASHHRVGGSALFVTLFYAIGVTLPLLVLAIVAQRTATSWKSLRSHLPVVRQVAGVVLGIATLAIAFNWLGAVQRDVPGYTSALEDHIESTNSACTQLRQLSGEKQNQFAAANAKLEGKKATCSATDAGNTQSAHLAAGRSTTTTTTTSPQSTTSPQKPTVFMANKTNLPNLGRAPNFTGITAWLNTPGNQPLSLSQLRGKVVLVDFWTYSCINCQRALPHVEGWYSDYKKDGLVVVGVSSPEFAFEHVVSNVKSAAGSLGIDYPVAVDDNLATWDAYNNEYWPAEYLIDPTGTVRAYDFGEGGYSSMESNIRMLLSANGVTDLPARTDVPDKTPTSEAITPESYVGYERLSNEVGTSVVKDKATVYHPPSSIPSNSLAFGGTWTVHSEGATAGSDATLGLQFTADDVYLVMSGEGTVEVSDNGRPLTTLNVGGVPKLYTLLSGSALQTGVLTLTVSPGVEAYDFTFG
ncbi:MAG TPA: cytochrome c biogenesis protein DipZ [Acidimicrobiales bacterium]|jgi:cytochrome c biogenesis protein CcdA/thiol-disulfide isomerase/thioredoxin